MINEDLLFSFGAELKTFDADDVIFSEGETPSYYYYIKEGKIKLNNYSENGKEFIQGIISKEKGFGESFLFTGKNYPVNAVTIEESEILRLPKQNYINFLQSKPDNIWSLLGCFSEHLHYKFLMMQSMAFQSPSHKIITLLDYLKDSYGDKDPFSMPVLLTRQQLASLTGLSVETVIRVIKLMEKNQTLQIRNRKIYY